MDSKRPFVDHLINEINNNKKNNYDDNWDYLLMGDQSKQKVTLKAKLNLIAAKWLPQKYYNDLLFYYYLKGHLNGLGYLYNNLNDEYSKTLLVQVITYRVLGPRKYKLPLSNQKYWDNLKLAESTIIDKNDFIDPGFREFLLHKMDLHKIGYPITFYFSPLGVLIDFIIKQYEYNVNNKVIKAEKDDVVLDCGGCWGDTALFFSNETGPGGKVYSFEFIPSNIGIFRKNLALNPHLSGCVTIIENPVWDTSEKKLFYKDFGPASKISDVKSDGFSGETVTIALDDFVAKEKISKVDLIKIDIEGAELNAVKGARETIIKFKPKLAIAVYHSLSDFYTIVQFLKSLDLGYKFYFQHATIHAGESVLFAEV